MSQDNTLLIDPSMLDSLSQFLSPDKLHALLCRYIEDSQRILEQLAESLSVDNAEEARRFVHSLKSTSANVGANSLSALAAELEQLAISKQLDAVAARVEDLHQLFESTKASIHGLDIMRQAAG